MKAFIIAVSALLNVLVTDASARHWQRQYKPASKAKYGHQGCNCMNGGTCISYYLFSGIKRCLCPERYSGDHCEIDAESRCYTSNGKDYRGTASESESRERCVAWDSPVLQRWPFNAGVAGAVGLGLGKHNHCRNPDGRAKPWCYVRRGYRTYSAPCSIPECEKESTCGRRSFSKTFKIVGGRQASIASQPWMAAIFHSRRPGTPSQFVCGGSLIDPCWILTAAHCFPEDIPNMSRYTVFLGKSAVNATTQSEQNFNVERMIIHEAYSHQTTDFNNDIALIRIRSSSGQCAQETDTVKTICLPSQGLLLRDSFQCEVSGYGRENRSSIYYSRILKTTSVHLISQSMCQKYYAGQTVNDNMFCAGDPQWKTDSCKGDSGGPIICEANDRMVLYGIVSWGDSCAKKEKPGVYTRVTKYLPWIESHINGVHFRSYYPPK